MDLGAIPIDFFSKPDFFSHSNMAVKDDFVLKEPGARAWAGAGGGGGRHFRIEEGTALTTMCVWQGSILPHKWKSRLFTSKYDLATDQSGRT